MLVLFISGVLSLIAGELGIRIKDRIVDGTPMLSNPSYSSTLRVRKYGIWVGRPNAHYQKWKLNAFGFRSEPIALAKKPGCTRIMIIGASEMFGLYEAPGKDFAADLTRDLKPEGCFEVINAAMAGMGMMAAKVYWDHYLHRFKPDLVLIYPAPDINFMVYLHHKSHPSALQTTAVKPVIAMHWHFHSRLLAYLRSFIHMPSAIANWRSRRAIAQKIAHHPKSWRIRHIPAAVLAAYKKRLQLLTADISASGSEPVLMTHALRITGKTYKNDESATLWVLSAGPRADAKAWIENDTGANTMMKEVAARRHYPVVHLSRHLSGCRACFFDGAHFTSLGAERAARIAETVLVKQSRALKTGTKLK